MTYIFTWIGITWLAIFFWYAIQRFLTNRPYVFLSYTVRYDNDRFVMDIIKKYLKKYDINYYDYTEYQVDDTKDSSKEIANLLENAIKKSSCSIEIVSHNILGDHPWVQTERSIISKQYERVSHEQSFKAMSKVMSKLEGFWSRFWSLEKKAKLVSKADLRGYGYVRFLIVIDDQYMQAYSVRGVVPVARIDFTLSKYRNIRELEMDAKILARSLKTALKKDCYGIVTYKLKARVEHPRGSIW